MMQADRSGDDMMCYPGPSVFFEVIGDGGITGSCGESL